MSSMSRMIFARMVVGFALGAFTTGIALAQQPASTWQQIKQRGELRIGVTPASRGISRIPPPVMERHRLPMGQQIAKDLGVKLVPVETTWGNSVPRSGKPDRCHVRARRHRRAEKGVDFPDAPFFWYAQGVLVRDGCKRELGRSRSRQFKIAVTLGPRPTVTSRNGSPRPRSSASRTWTRLSRRSIQAASTARRSITPRW